MITQTDRDRIAAADGMLRGYRYHVRELAELDDDIALLDYRMAGVHGVSWGGVPGGHTDREHQLLVLMEKRDEKERQAAALRQYLHQIDEALLAYSDEDQELIHEYYMTPSTTYEAICDKHFMSRESVRRRVQAVLRTIPLYHI